MTRIAYANFDGLDIAYHGLVPNDVLEFLETATREAREREAAVEAEMLGERVTVHAYAGPNASYRFDTSEEGEIWWVRRSSRRDGDWTLRCSVRSAAFVARGGLKAIRDQVDGRLDHWGFHRTQSAEGVDNAVSRVDFAVDFLDPDRSFVLDPSNFVTRGTKRSNHLMAHGESHWAARRCTGVTVGKLPGRQLQVYDKTLEINHSGKAWWRDVWGLGTGEKARVWRVETRLGKRYLREQARVRTMDDVASRIVELIGEAMTHVRMVQSAADPNISRCPEMAEWSALRAAAMLALRSVAKGFGAGKVMEIKREKVDHQLRQMLRGRAVSLAALRGVADNQATISQHLEKLLAEVRRSLISEAERVSEIYERARGRYACAA